MQWFEGEDTHATKNVFEPIINNTHKLFILVSMNSGGRWTLQRQNSLM